MTPHGDKRSGATLAQVMAWCLTAPSHYLNQCWLVISEVLWHPNFPGADELTHCRLVYWHHMATKIWVNIGSQWVFKLLFCKMSLKSCQNYCHISQGLMMNWDWDQYLFRWSEDKVANIQQPTVSNKAGSVQPSNTVLSRQNGHHFTDNIYKCIFSSENSVFWLIFH